MHDYDFIILQPNEFECLTRDLLQKKEGVFVESFTSGRDGGIDLRFATINGGKGIVQCKRYDNFKELLGQLKKEVEKVKRLSPSRYILSTSVGLTPHNKDVIMALFDGYIKSTDDIWGRDELNNLLGQNPDIEKQYYKLWLGSSAVLESIVNKRIENWSGFELEEIKREVSTYVMNDSFNEALKILHENRYVIISGIPGIGKTTLARMLIFHILGNGYDEFIKVSSMEDAAQKFAEGKKQIFFFDDFLGANFLEVKESGFEDKLLAFIQKVQRTPDKLFILSTREYILSAARRQFEKFELRNIEIAKCTIELSKYNEDIRAKILYNHLAESNLPSQYVEEILRERKYLKIIKHQNFNPRIIEAFMGKALYKSTDPKQFVGQFLDFFDRPYSVWKFAFQKMSPLAQSSLFVLLSMGGCSLLNDWKIAVEHFVKGTKSDLHLEITEQTWNEMIELLEGTFIVFNKSGKGYVVEFHNPSVYDFLLDYLRDFPQTQLWLIENAAFSDQVLNIFTDKKIKLGEYGMINVSEEWGQSIITTIKAGAERPISAKLERSKGYYIPNKLNIAKFLYGVQSHYPVLVRSNAGFIESFVTPDLILDENIDIDDRINLLSIVDEKRCGIDIKKVISLLMRDCNWSFQLSAFLSVLEDKGVIPDLLDDISFYQMINSIVDDEISNITTEEEGEALKSDISEICRIVPDLDEDAWIDAIDTKFPDVIVDEPDVDEDWARETYYHSRHSDGNQYEEMFTSLLE